MGDNDDRRVGSMPDGDNKVELAITCSLETYIENLLDWLAFVDDKPPSKQRRRELLCMIFAGTPFILDLGEIIRKYPEGSIVGSLTEVYEKLLAKYKPENDTSKQAPPG